MAAPVLILLLLGSAVAAARRQKRRRQLPAEAVIVSPRKSTVYARDGAVTSVQTGELSMPSGQLERLWTAANLENLARTYWLFLSKMTLGLIRVVYGERDRRVVLLTRRLTLLRFDAPEYEFESLHGTVRWQIRDGLLVARAGRSGGGHLQLDVRREAVAGPDAKIRIEVEVANFYPAIAAGFSKPVYMVTQAFIHVLVTHAFLRSLATLELAESKVKALAPEEGPAATESAPQTPVQP